MFLFFLHGIFTNKHWIEGTLKPAGSPMIFMGKSMVSASECPVKTHALMLGIVFVGPFPRGSFSDATYTGRKNTLGLSHPQFLNG